MTTEFHFKGFQANDELSRIANQTLDRILELCPYGASALGLLRRDGSDYRCAIDVYSRSGPFIAEGRGQTPEDALDRAESIIARKLARWRERRFSSRREMRREFDPVA